MHICANTLIDLRVVVAHFTSALERLAPTLGVATANGNKVLLRRIAKPLLPTYGFAAVIPFVRMFEIVGCLAVEMPAAVTPHQPMQAAINAMSLAQSDSTHRL